MISENARALLILCSTPGLGPVKTGRLLNFFQNATEILKSTIEELSAISGISTSLAKEITNWETRTSWQQDLKLVEKFNVQLLAINEKPYPSSLKELSSPPPLLYVLGSIEPQDENTIAVVGTRNPSVYGIDATTTLCKQMTKAGLTIISGLARGIDTVAHQTALDSNGRTLAVIGSGFARLYPQENRELARKIKDSGALISEYPMNTPPDRKNFPKRNRIVAALAKASLLIEAPEKSGALITMEMARSLKRSCFSIPGRIDIPSFKGNHHLIKTNAANLVDNSCDILKSFNISLETTAPSLPSLSEQEERFLNLFSGEELCVDAIVSVSPFPITKVNTLLMSLILKKRLREYPGKVFKRLY